MLPVLNAFTDTNPLAIALMENLNAGKSKAEHLTDSVHLMSRLIKGYHDLVGGGGKNTGFVVERNSDDVPLAVRLVKIDPGESFNFEGEHNQFIHSFNPFYKGHKLSDPKDFQYGNMQPRSIAWSKLLDEQRHRFLYALRKGYEVLKNNKVLDFIIRRRGVFDQMVPGARKLLSDQMVQPFKQAWMDYMDHQSLPQVYGSELKSRPIIAMPEQKAIFNPKPIGAANYTLDEVQRLSLEA